MGAARIQRRRKASRTTDVAAEDGPDEAQVDTIKLALAMGRQWTRVDATKLVALYRAFPVLAKDGDPEAGLPPVSESRGNLRSVGDILSAMSDEESTLSGVTDHDANDRLKALVDLSDTMTDTADALATL